MFSAFPISHFARHSVRPQYVNTSTNSSSGFLGSGSVNISKPTGTSQGDVMVALVVGHSTDNISPPAGWATVYENDYFFRESEYRSHGFYVKLVGSSEPSSYSWSFSADGIFDTPYMCGAIVTYSLASKKSPATAWLVSTGNATTHQILVPAGVVRDQFPVFVTGWHGMRNSATSYTPSSSMTGLGGLVYGAGSRASSVHMFEQELTGPSDPLIGTFLEVDYSASIDADSFGVILEGTYA